MAEDRMAPEAQAEWYADEDVHIKRMSQWLARWPNFRRHAAYAQLGAAIAFADLVGIDVEDFVAYARLGAAIAFADLIGIDVEDFVAEGPGGGAEVAEDRMAPEAQAEWYADEDVHIKRMSQWLARWPNFRRHAAYVQLGAAIAFADLIGIDVEDFVKKLRAAGNTPAASGQITPPRPS